MESCGTIPSAGRRPDRTTHHYSLVDLDALEDRLSHQYRHRHTDAYGDDHTHPHTHAASSYFYCYPIVALERRTARRACSCNFGSTPYECDELPDSKV